jgi:hypothetical protein
MMNSSSIFAGWFLLTKMAKRKPKKRPVPRRKMPPPTRVTPDKRRRILDELAKLTRRLGLYD